MQCIFESERTLYIALRCHVVSTRSMHMLRPTVHVMCSIQARRQVGARPPQRYHEPPKILHSRKLYFLRLFRPFAIFTYCEWPE